MGYVGYDVVRSFERIPALLPQDLALYDCYFMITDTLLIFDNLKQKIKVISNVFLDGSQSPEEAYREAEEKIAGIKARLRAPAPPHSRRNSFSPLPLRPNLSREEFMKGVERAKEYIQAGDVIQVVLSQRFSAELHCDPFDIYRALRSINPSPYLFYLKMDDAVLLGASPEVMVRLEGKQIELRPLAGTRRRGKTPEEDQEMEKDLLADEKERAEHIMLVDLGTERRGPGGGDRFGGSDGIDGGGTLFPCHAHRLQHPGPSGPGKECFRCLPGGLSRRGRSPGSPKIRAMEIIEELEPTRRGPYAGAVGYFSFSGNMDTCITIRSILIKDGKAYHPGGRGNCRRFRAGERVRRDSEQSPGHLSGDRAGRGGIAMILLIDNYDSFTYNLVQYLGELGASMPGLPQ